MADNSLQNTIQGSWKYLSGSVRSEWGKLTDSDVEQVKGNSEVLAGKIQERYGITEAKAKTQIEQWANKFRAQQTEQSNSNTSNTNTSNSDTSAT